MKKKLLFLLGLLSIFTISLVSYGDNSNKLDLRMNFKAGQSFVEHDTYEENVVMSLPDEKIETKEIIKTTITQEVLNVDSMNNVDLRITFKEVYNKIQGPNETYEFDSTRAGAKKTFSELRPEVFAGIHYVVHLSSKGKVLSIQGLSDMKQYILKRLINPKKSVLDRVKKICSADELLGTSEDGDSIYPEQPISIGDSWSGTRIENLRLPKITEYTLQLKERKNGRAILNYTGTIKPNPNGEPEFIDSAMLTYSLSGTENGTVEMDEATGMEVASNITQDCSGIVTGDGLPGTSTTRMWPIFIKATETTVTTEVK